MVQARVAIGSVLVGTQQHEWSKTYDKSCAELKWPTYSDVVILSACQTFGLFIESSTRSLLMDHKRNEPLPSNVVHTAAGQ